MPAEGGGWALPGVSLDSGQNANAQARSVRRQNLSGTDRNARQILDCCCARVLRQYRSALFWDILKISPPPAAPCLTARGWRRYPRSVDGRRPDCPTGSSRPGGCRVLGTQRYRYPVSAITARPVNRRCGAASSSDSPPATCFPVPFCQCGSATARAGRQRQYGTGWCPPSPEDHRQRRSCVIRPVQGFCHGEHQQWASCAAAFTCSQRP